jgi:hypothetical protein
MFRKNNFHRQPPLLSSVQSLPKKQRQRLKNSWADVFYHQFFSRLDETIFSVLYAEKASRPNVPVNILVSLEFLKAGHNWSDEEMYDQFQYNMQVRYALGLHTFDTGQFELRTVYNFRRRLAQYQLKSGENLLGKAFAQVTDEQLAAYGIRSEKQRMDSSQIGSNIADASRLQLVVTGVQRAAKLLTDEQQAENAELLAPYTEQKAKLFVYQVKGKDATQAALLASGEVLAKLLPMITIQTAEDEVAGYEAVSRLFAENFNHEGEAVTVKTNKEIGSGALQSLDDLEATFRRKGGDKYKGYVMNITETCDPDNELQLITHVQVASNNTDDATLLCAAIPVLSERTQLTDLYSDGGFGSPEADLVLCKHGVALHQTHLRGKAPAPERYSLADFHIGWRDHDDPAYLGCPHGQIVPIIRGRSTGFMARFNVDRCQTCPAYEQACRVKLMKRSPVCQLEFTLAELLWARRRQRHRHLRSLPNDIRAAIEATVRAVKHPSRGQLPVRGLHRVADMVIGSAAIANIRSILRFHKRKWKRKVDREMQEWQKAVTSKEMKLFKATQASLCAFSSSHMTPNPFVFVACFSC